MRLSMKTLSGLVVATLTLALVPAAHAIQAHAHVGHVATAWGDTPDGQGLLAAAEGEAEIALAHAGYAIGDLGNLASIQLHTRHVVHALKPSSIDGGPGLGYGLTTAADGVIAHIGLAAGSDDASGAVKVHAVHIGTSSGNVAAWCAEVLALAHTVLMAEDAAAAAEVATEIEALVQAIVNGRDADGDGNIGWKEGEGGLAQARLHTGLVLKAEGLD